MLQCKNGENCNQIYPKDRRIAVEAKCLCPSEDFPKFPQYRMPTHHVPQTLCEMAVNNVNELWLLSFTLYSMSIIVVYFDLNLWVKLMDLAEEKYGGDKVSVPTKLHHTSKSLSGCENSPVFWAPIVLSFHCTLENKISGNLQAVSVQFSWYCYCWQYFGFLHPLGFGDFM